MTKAGLMETLRNTTHPTGNSSNAVSLLFLRYYCLMLCNFTAYEGNEKQHFETPWPGLFPA